MKEEYLKYILAFKKLSTDNKQTEILSQLIELIQFTNTINNRLNDAEKPLPVLTTADNEDEYLDQLFTLLLSLKEENGKLVNYLIENKTI